MGPRVAAFCGDCHATPAPDTFPRDAWPAEVQQGYNFYAESGRHDLEVPPLNQVVAYYRALAPAKWTLPDPPPASSGPIRFAPRRMPFEAAEFPAVSHIRWQAAGEADTDADTDEEGGGELLWCDMRQGLVSRTPLDAPWREDWASRTETLAAVPHPAHVTPTDLDGDGREDYLVADLGSYLPEDHRDGRVIWVRPAADGQSAESYVILDQVGRVADVRTADFNADGQLDLIVAEFGWRQTGKLLMLWGDGRASGRPKFREEVLDPRHGIIHVPVVDLNGDGRPDFVALVSQEHECIDAFLNRGDGTFERRTLFTAGDPSYGSSGIQLVDMDGDGDWDILYTNGDTMDSFYLKPYHAVHWLENLGDLEFRGHRLTTMPGVYRAVAGDLDGDGDQDIAACAYIPSSRLKGESPETAEAYEAYDAVIWLEQRAAGKFVRHVLEKSNRGHMALELADTDGDGDLDVIVGSYGNQPEEDAEWMVIWENQGPAE